MLRFPQTPIAPSPVKTESDIEREYTRRSEYALHGTPDFRRRMELEAAASLLPELTPEPPATQQEIARQTAAYNRMASDPVNMTSYPAAMLNFAAQLVTSVRNSGEINQKPYYRPVTVTAFRVGGPGSAEGGRSVNSML